MPKLQVSKLLVLTCVAYAQASHIMHLPRSVTDICPSAQELESSRVTIEEHDIVHRTFSCPDGDFNIEAFSDAMSTSTTSQLSSLEARSQAECTTPATECQCGVAVDCECASIRGTGPSKSDCQTLISSTAVIASLQGPTFLVQPKTFRVITLNTCSLGFLNLATFTEEFCWDDLGNQGNTLVADGCVSGDNTSGTCLSTNQHFLTRLGHSN